MLREAGRFKPFNTELMLNKILTEKLNALFNQSADFIDYDEMKVTFEKNASATLQDIVSISKNSKITLPQDYLNFLQLYNGCVLFKRWQL